LAHRNCWAERHGSSSAALGDITTVIHPVFVAMSGIFPTARWAGSPTRPGPAVWATYEQTYTQASMTPAFYFDQPGNHDGYADVGLHSYLGTRSRAKPRASSSPRGPTPRPSADSTFFRPQQRRSRPDISTEKPEFTADELTFLESSLAASPDAELALVFAHHPIDGAPGGDSVAQLLENYGGAFYLHGHEHLYNEKIVSTPFVVSNQVGSLGQNDTDNVAVGVVDHNAFIYRATDVVAPWPLIIITAPVSHTLRDSEVPNPGPMRYARTAWITPCAPWCSRRMRLRQSRSRWAASRPWAWRLLRQRRRYTKPWSTRARCRRRLRRGRHSYDRRDGLLRDHQLAFHGRPLRPAPR